MIGEYRVIVSDQIVKYDFTIRRNFTFIQGNSGTGKTTLCELIADASNGRRASAKISCKRSCQALTDVINWKMNILNNPKTIFFIDEDFKPLRTEEFASLAKKADCYFVICSRYSFSMLPYSIKEIYGLRESGNFEFIKPRYDTVENYLYQYYNISVEHEIRPDVIICEDSNSGFEMMQFLVKGLAIECISANGKSNIAKILEQKFDYFTNKVILVVADGAAIGADISGMYKIAKLLPNCYFYMAESFEYLILRTVFRNNAEIAAKIKETYNYADSCQFASWERFFTDLLEQKTRQTDLEYHKKSLNSRYLRHDITQVILRFLQDSKIYLNSNLGSPKLITL